MTPEDFFKAALDHLDATAKPAVAVNEQLLEWQKAQAWQPIETAPRDGTAFDIWVKSTKNPDYGVRMTSVYFSNGIICGMRWPQSCFGEYASHWMQLPEAPREGK